MPKFSSHGGGDTGKIPLMMKGYRLMVQYLNRVTNLPNESLAKKSLFENIELKTNWIATIEKLINYFNLSESFQNPSKLPSTGVSSNSRVSSNT